MRPWWGQIHDVAINACEVVKKNPILDELARGSIKQIPVIGEILLGFYDKYTGSSDEDKTSEILDVLQYMANLDQKMLDNFCDELEKNRDQVIKNGIFLSKIVSNTSAISDKLDNLVQRDKHKQIRYQREIISNQIKETKLRRKEFAFLIKDLEAFLTTNMKAIFREQYDPEKDSYWMLDDHFQRYHSYYDILFHADKLLDNKLEVFIQNLWYFTGIFSVIANPKGRNMNTFNHDIDILQWRLSKRDKKIEQVFSFIKKNYNIDLTVKDKKYEDLYAGWEKILKLIKEEKHELMDEIMNSPRLHLENFQLESFSKEIDSMR